MAGIQIEIVIKEYTKLQAFTFFFCRFDESLISHWNLNPAESQLQRRVDLTF